MGSSAEGKAVAERPAITGFHQFTDETEVVHVINFDQIVYAKYDKSSASGLSMVTLFFAGGREVILQGELADRVFGRMAQVPPG